MCLRWKNHTQPQRLGTASLGSSFAEKNVEYLAENKLTISEQRALVMAKTKHALCCVSKCVVSRSREAVVLYLAIVIPHNLGSPVRERR